MPNSTPLRLVTLAPGHFHAALVQKEALPEVDPHAVVYSPLDSDLIAHLERIARFNARSDQPTAWRVDVCAGDDWLDRFRKERPGNVVVIAGRNRTKIDLIQAAVSLGYCVLADKPWIVVPEDFPKLQQALADAEREGVFVWDIMTERFEATTRLQRELMSDPDVFGEPLDGTVDEPAMVFESVHYLSKKVAGVPLRRPAWWFDPNVAGEAIADVGTHLADLAMWLGFPEQAIDFQKDIQVISSKRWPTMVDRESFCEITGLADYPAELASVVRSLRDRADAAVAKGVDAPQRAMSGHGVPGPQGDELHYHGNGSVLYRLRGRYVRLTTKWGVRADGPEGDTHLAIARGPRSTVSVLHDATLGIGPQVAVMPVSSANKAAIIAAIDRLCRGRIGYKVRDFGDRIHVVVPESERTGHESHFASVLLEFVNYFRDRSKIPAWERGNLLAKYYVTTHATSM